MAHFAQLDDNNLVMQVIVIDNSSILDELGKESEALGIQICKSIFGENTKWLQTSYNNKFRGVYAGIGFTYNPELDIFIQPYYEPAISEPTPNDLLVNQGKYDNSI